jgi:hypothetical protein
MNLSSESHDSKRSGELYQTINLGHSVNNLLETILFQIIPMLVDLAVAFAYLYYLFGVYMALVVAAVVLAYLWASTYFNARQITVRRGLVATCWGGRSCMTLWEAGRQYLTSIASSTSRRGTLRRSRITCCLSGNIQL